MNKANRWRVTRRQYRGFRDTVQTGIGSADAFVQEVTTVPIVGVIFTSLSLQAISLGQEFIHLAHSCALDPA